MNAEEFERLNALSEKALNDTATLGELDEFSQLFTSWNKSTEYNLFHGTYNSKD